MKRPGRPPLDPSDPSVAICLKVPGRRYDALYVAAQTARVSIPEMIRRQISKLDRHSDGTDADMRRASRVQPASHQDD
jgi:hypothetical protein